MSEPVQELRSSYPPFLAWIEVDGKRVNHYKSVNDGKVFSAFVESVAGSSWALCYKPLAESPKYDFTVEGWVDGGRFEFKSWEGAYAALKTPPAAPARVRKFATTKVSETEERNLIFSKVEHAPSAFSDGQQRPRPGLGTIQLKVALGKLNKDYADRPKSYDKSFLEQDKIEDGTVDKSISNRSALGAAQVAKPRTYQTFKPNNSGGQPDVMFEFHYRSKAALELEGITVSQATAEIVPSVVIPLASSKPAQVVPATPAPPSVCQGGQVADDKPVATLAPKVDLLVDQPQVTDSGSSSCEALVHSSAADEEQAKLQVGAKLVVDDNKPVSSTAGQATAELGEPPSDVTTDNVVEANGQDSHSNGLEISKIDAEVETKSAGEGKPTAEPVTEVKEEPPTVGNNSNVDSPKPLTFTSSPLRNEVVVEVADAPVQSIEEVQINASEMVEMTSIKEEKTLPSISSILTDGGDSVPEPLSSQAPEEMSQLAESQLTPAGEQRADIVASSSPSLEDVKMPEFDSVPAPPEATPVKVEQPSIGGMDDDQVELGKRKLEDGEVDGVEEKKPKLEDEGGPVAVAKNGQVGIVKAEAVAAEDTIAPSGPEVTAEKVVIEDARMNSE